MRTIIVFLMGIVFIGCENPSEMQALSKQINATDPPKTLKQSLTCTTAGQNGYLVPYSVEYVLNTYVDGDQIATCVVKDGATSNAVSNLECPSTDPLAITYSIIAVYPHGSNQAIIPYTKYISETFDPHSSACDVVNY